MSLSTILFAFFIIIFNLPKNSLFSLYYFFELVSR